MLTHISSQNDQRLIQRDVNIPDFDDAAEHQVLEVRPNFEIVVLRHDILRKTVGFLRRNSLGHQWIGIFGRFVYEETSGIVVACSAARSDLKAIDENAAARDRYHHSYLQLIVNAIHTDLMDVLSTARSPACAARQGCG